MTHFSPSTKTPQYLSTAQTSVHEVASICPEQHHSGRNRVVNYSHSFRRSPRPQQGHYLSLLQTPGPIQRRVPQLHHMHFIEKKLR